ncbi:MAG: methyltransferase domain-containing protein [Bacteroidetes bacterium]|nr:methyltransferase domain-containing protein [Bacteroidota bacterium]MCC6656189.1 methyltransferase domain-containing protein [Flavobacteriales bacterium]HMU13029.1 class I SAM-dependent methyltransferase [Flavobacteriales bacterium]HNE81640.1 class I SAM-dependent methyltransferase [Flavobacteriales bacterium]HNO04650.1 class I SAM-dependent methyltransferase [Flavobacteriales bacterium]
MTITEQKTDTDITASEARAAAQRIAFGPVLFQACQTMRRNGLFDALRRGRQAGSTEVELLAATALSPYGLRVLLDITLTSDVVWQQDDRYGLTKTGHMLASDEMTRVNLDFVDDVCYAGLQHLEESIREGKPAGLRELGPWKTVYEGLAHLPAAVRKSWFEFDNHYSDRSYPAALPIVFRERPGTIMDVGANNGKWSLACLQHDPQVRMIAVDLPGQLRDLERNLTAAGMSHRVDLRPTDMLDPTSTLPSGADVIWMSQFLDCFGEDEVVSILRKAHTAMAPHSALYIMETFIDRQRFEAGAFSLAATSLYFTAMANGNSRMYRAEHFEPLVEQAGLRITERIDDLGLGHSLLRCVRP